jgi:hypothetical protein
MRGRPDKAPEQRTTGQARQQEGEFDAVGGVSGKIRIRRTAPALARAPSPLPPHDCAAGSRFQAQ